MTHLSVGQQLTSARTEKGLSLDQAAHLTKIRPDKLAALEADDFTAFPNNTYARGFLLIYGKFLRVEVSELANKLENDNPIAVEDYQYLSAQGHELPEQRARMRPRETKAKRPSIAPLVVFIVLVVFVGFGVHFFMNTQRIGDLDRANRAALVEDANPGETADGASGSAPVPTAQASAPSETAAAPNAEPAPAASVETVPGSPDGQASSPAPASTSKSAGPNELAIEPVKKSWVRIRRDDPVSEPVFDDFLYPGVGPLKIKGTKFFIEVRDDGQVQLRKNGQPLAYQPPGMVIE